MADDVIERRLTANMVNVESNDAEFRTLLFLIHVSMF